MKYEMQESQEVMNCFGTPIDGLTPEKVIENREKYGENKLKEEKAKSPVLIFISQFKDFLVMILIVAALLSMFMGKIESTIVIIAVLILNAMLGTIQHIKAEESLKSLKALSAPTAKVKREGQVIEIPSSEVVVGDLLVLDAGDYVAADCRIIECNSLKANESALTGESEGVEKTEKVLKKETLALGDHINRVFSSSFVTYGRGVAIVTEVGMQTEIGKISDLISSAKEKATPLQKNLDAFGKKLAIVIIIISAIVFGLSFYHGSPIMDALMFAISLAVAAIPEALSSIVTIVLALGTRKLAAENAIIRKLHSVESLGSISVICSDKTGTLTQNKMTIKKIFINNQLIDAEEINIEDSLTEKLVLSGILCGDVVKTEEKTIGDPTEIAMVDFGEKYNKINSELKMEYPRLSELPFDSDRKLMTTKHELNGKFVSITKGALDVILKRSIKIETADGVREITKTDIENFEKINFQLSDSGLRVLAFAWKEADENPLEMNAEEDLVLIGIMAMMDPPRVDSAEAVYACKNAGIKPIMITGDHKITAKAIAREIGLYEEGDMVLEGADIENMTDEELKAIAPSVSVYARVSPEHKIRIVSAWQTLGNVVAMTGDGVNDAPALKKADVGVAMGITGTEVAKDAASMVLTDDRFATIVKAINNGRSIFGNIMNAVKFLLSGNTAGILAVIYASLVGLPAPFAPVHLLFINLLTDSLPAIAIGIEPAHSSLMNDKPRDVNRPIMDRKFMLEILFEGLVIGIVTMTAFYMGMNSGSVGAGMTMAFATLSLSRLVHGFNCRTNGPLTRKNVFSNPYSFYALLVGIVLILCVLLIKPLYSLFEITMLSLEQIGWIFGLSIIPLIVVQIAKRIIEKIKK